MRGVLLTKIDKTMWHTNRTEPNLRINGQERDQEECLKIKKGLLKFLSVLNIGIFSISAALELLETYVGQGIWGSIIHMISGYIGVYASKKPTKKRLAYVVVFSLMSILFGFIVIGFSWLGYKECVDHDPKSCTTPGLLLAMMAVNILAVVDSTIIVSMVFWSLRNASKQTTNINNLGENRGENLSVSSAPIATINTPTLPTAPTPVTRPDLSSSGMTAIVSPNGVRLIPSYQYEMEIMMLRMAVANQVAQIVRRQQEQEDLPPSYSEAVVNSEHQTAPTVLETETQSTSTL